LICSGSIIDTEWVHNVGNLALIVSYPPSFTGTNAAEFSLVSPTSAKTIQPGDSLPYVLQLTSNVIGPKTATMVLVTNDNNHPDTTRTTSR